MPSLTGDKTYYMIKCMAWSTLGKYATLVEDMAEKEKDRRASVCKDDKLCRIPTSHDPILSEVDNLSINDH